MHDANSDTPRQMPLMAAVSDVCADCPVGTLSTLPVQQHEITVRELWDLMDRWQDALVAQGIGEATREQYDSYFLKLLRRTRTDPATLDIDRFNAHLAKTKARGSTRNATIQAARSFFRFAIRRKLLDADPTEDAKIRSPKHPKSDYYTQEEFSRIVMAATTHRPPQRPWAIILLLETGSRIGAMAAVRPDDIKGDRIHFRHTKNDRPYSVKLTPAGQEAVEELLAMMRPDQDTLVGCAKTTLWAWFNQAAREAGLPPGRRHPHLARHTAATALYKRTKDPLLVQEFLNHADLSQIPRYVAVVQDESDQALAVSLFEEAL
jgi:integrase/recombinase XerC